MLWESVWVHLGNMRITMNEDVPQPQSKRREFQLNLKKCNVANLLEKDEAFTPEMRKIDLSEGV